MTEPKKDKVILICGDAGEGAKIAARMAKGTPDEIVIMTPNEALEKGLDYNAGALKENNFDMLTIPKWQTLPETRAERREKARKKKRR